MSKIRYAKDKFGALVFEPMANPSTLGLDNCLVIHGAEGLYVFPINTIQTFISTFSLDGKVLRTGYGRWYNRTDDFKDLLNKYPKRYFLVDGKQVEGFTHNICAHKVKYLTGDVACTRNYNAPSGCHFKAATDKPFKWNKSVCSYIKPHFADNKGQTRRSVFFTELTPTLAVEKVNKEKMTARGKMAQNTRLIVKAQCARCMWKTTCKSKTAKCPQYTSRKMLNRNMRRLAARQFGSWERLKEMSQYIGGRFTFEKKDYEVVMPLNQYNIYCRRSAEQGHYGRNYYALSLMKVLDANPQMAKREVNEYDVKILMFFLAANIGSNITQCEPNSQYGNYCLTSKIRRGGYENVHDYNMKSYYDVIAAFMNEGREQYFKVMKGGKIR